MGPENWQGREAMLTTGVKKTSNTYRGQQVPCMNEETESGVRKARAEA